GDEAQKARSNAQRAERSEQQTKDALTQVESQKADVESSLTKAEQAERVALAAEKQSRAFRYATDMQLAAMLVEDDAANAGKVMSGLPDHEPARNKTGGEQEDLRGFEWRYLKRRAEGGAAVFTGFERPPADSVLTPEGDLLTLDSEGLLKRWDATTRQ